MGPSRSEISPENTDRIPKIKRYLPAVALAEAGGAKAKSFQQLVVNAVELAVGEDGNDVAVMEIGNKPIDDLVGVG